MPGELQIRTHWKALSSVADVRETRLTMDEQTFRDFYDQTARPLFSYLLRTSGRREVAEDVFQESYCRLLSVQLPFLDGAQTRNYLFKIATNLLRDRWRRNREATLDVTQDTPAGEGDADERVALRQAFARLKLRDRELLWLAYVEGADHKQIAHDTGLKAGSIRLLLYRARKKLVKLIHGDAADPRKEER